MRGFSHWKATLFLIVGIGLLTFAGLDSWKREGFTAQILVNESSSASAANCSPAQILYYNLQPSLYGRDGELAAFREAKTLGFSIVSANRTTAKQITDDLIDPYNVLWLQSGCAGEAYPLKDTEIAAIRKFYLRGGSLIIEAGDNYGGGIYGPPNASCQYRGNQIAENLGLKFSGKLQYATSNDGCRTVKSGTSTLLTGVSKIFRESSGEMQVTGDAVWGKDRPVFVGSIEPTKAPAFAVIAKTDKHGGAIFSPQDQGMQMRCSGQDGTLYKNIFAFLNHQLNCVAPTGEQKETEILGGLCTMVEKSLYGSGAIRVPCPSGTVIMGGGWENGTANIFDYSRPLTLGNGWECHGNQEDATGKCHALCCDSFSFESLIQTKGGTVSNTLAPSCPSAYTPVGGGFFSHAKNKYLDKFLPQEETRGWTCYADEKKGTSTAECFAVCARLLDKEDTLTCATETKNGPQDSPVTVQCPYGTFATGGGFQNRTAAEGDREKSMPNADATGWVCERDGSTNKTDAGSDVCYARCCRWPAVALTAMLTSSAARSSMASVQSSSPLSSAASSTAISLPASSSTSSVVSAEQSSSVIAFSSVLLPPSSAPPLPSSIVSIIASVTPASSSSSAASLPKVIASSQSSFLTVTFSSASAPPFLSSIKTVAMASSKNACAPGTCRKTGNAYCKTYNQRCAEIGTEPCFVCLAEVTGLSAPSSMHVSSLPLPVIAVEQSSQTSSIAPSSLSLAHSSVATRPTTAARSVAAASSTQTVLQAALLEPWRPSAQYAGVPLGASGPGALAAMVAGAAAGFAWMRKQRK